MNWSEIYAYSLFKYHVADSMYYFIRTTELPRSGFGSLYYVTEECTQALEKAGTAAFKGTVWSPALWIDTDTDHGALSTEQRLRALGLRFNKWATGNRGAHFEIERPHDPSHLLPRIDKEWVISNFVDVDTSVYTHLNLFRLPGAIHEKTGERKRIIERVAGRPLILPDTIAEAEMRDIEWAAVSKSIFVDDMVMAMTVPNDEGNRHTSLLNLGVYLKKQGEPIEFIARWLYHTNLLSKPIGERELDNIIDFVARAE